MQETTDQPSDTPPGASDYTLHNAAHHLPQPPTPPVSNPGAGSIVSQDLAPTSVTTGEAATGSFLTDGGKPWYLKNYDSVTQTFVEPQWAGREAARGMSEELSEIDDDELRDLGEGVDVDISGGDGGTVGEEKAAEKTTPKKPKAKKRWRGYR
jgi:NuA3 HAT complex component NTO1